MAASALATAVAVLVGGFVAIDSSPSEAASTDVVLAPVDVAWTTTRAPKTPQLTNYLSATKSQDRTYLKFDGAALDGDTVTKATLVLRVRETTAKSAGVTVSRTSSSWSSKTLVHDNRPALSGAKVSLSSPVAKAKKDVRIPIDPTAISSGGSFSLAVNYVQKHVQLKFLRSGQYAPKLEVTVSSAAPSTPKPTATPTATPKPTATATPKPTATATPTAKPTPTATPAPVPAGAPKVFAHYFVPYPLSLDNKETSTDYYARNYLKPEGENGKWAKAGGLLRDRPVPPGVSKAADWQVQNFMTEIRQAKAAGIDGWTLNLLTASGQNWESVLNMMTAADKVGGFLIVPMVDGTASFSTQPASTVAKLLNDLYTHPSVYKIDGEFLLSSFKVEGRSLSWWKDVINKLETQYKRPITFQAVFLNASDANMKAFAPIADGFGNWGMRTERNILRTKDNDARAEALGKTWMEPVALQDVRPRSYVYAESSNTGSVRAQWEKAIREDVDFVQIVTWNDYSESTHINPSVAHGDSFLDITRYYTSWFHRAKAPAISSDEIVLTHRKQMVDAKPSYSHTLMAPNLGGESFTPEDNAEALVWLTAPATVKITAGGKTTTYSAPAGVSAYTAPLGVGTVSAQIVRGDTKVVSLTSPTTVVSKPYVQDLQYYAVSSW